MSIRGGGISRMSNEIERAKRENERLKDEVRGMRAEREMLWDALDHLWAELDARTVKHLSEEQPHLVQLAQHAHHRMSHEQRTMHRPAFPRPEGANGGVELGGWLAYQSKKGCQSTRCRQIDGVCIGWHCPSCDEPCGPQGHQCEGRGA